MGYIRAVGSGGLWHIHDRVRNSTLCGLPIIGKTEQTHSESNPLCTCPRCQEARLRQLTGQERTQVENLQGETRGHISPVSLSNRPPVESREIRTNKGELPLSTPTSPTPGSADNRESPSLLDVQI